jgi:hypothetical protein
VSGCESLCGKDVKADVEEWVGGVERGRRYSFE